jgi:hypothetical protein
VTARCKLLITRHSPLITAFMTPERWKQIEKIYHSTLQREPKEQAVFLDQACQGDEELRREVESLLAVEPQVDSFIEAPALGVRARGQSLVGQELGPYKILSWLGAGGMGEVIGPGILSSTAKWR